MARPRDPVVPERVTGPVRDLERSRTDPDLDGMATTVLLCSDGLFNELSGDEIASTLGSVSDPEVAANQLVTQAKDNGGNDNITAVVLDIQQ
jgi:serine/threonine protein phosphatase PrpC